MNIHERVTVGARCYVRIEYALTGDRRYYMVRKSGRSMVLDARHTVIKALIDAAIDKRNGVKEE